MTGPASSNRHADAHAAAADHLSALAPFSEWADEDDADPDAMPETAGPWCGCDTCQVREALAAAWPHALAHAADLLDVHLPEDDLGARELLREAARQATLPGREVPAP